MKKEAYIREAPLDFAKPVEGKGVMLRCEGDLDGYIFCDDQHAQEWLSQGFVNDAEYSVEIVTTKMTRCCHKLIKAKTLQKLSVSEFLGRLNNDEI